MEAIQKTLGQKIIDFLGEKKRPILITDICEQLGINVIDHARDALETQMTKGTVAFCECGGYALTRYMHRKGAAMTKSAGTIKATELLKKRNKVREKKEAVKAEWSALNEELTGLSNAYIRAETGRTNKEILAIENSLLK